MAWGGKRPGAGRKPNPNKAPERAERPALRASTKVGAPLPSMPETSLPIDANSWASVLPAIEEISRKYARQSVQRTPDRSPFRLPAFPKGVKPPDKTLAMDEAFSDSMSDYTQAWVGGDILAGQAGEGLAFLGYTYLAELALRAEYRVMSETIADDATRRWIDFDIAGDENSQKESDERARKDPVGEYDRQNDPDEKVKRLKAAGKMDRVRELEEHQQEIRAQTKFYDTARNDGFFGRTHLYLDIRTNGAEEATPEENKTPIGNGRDTLSKSKCPVGAFKGLRVVEPVWSYPLMYNANKPLRADWYNPQVWYVMGEEVHGSRFLTFVGRPVPDMLKPAYAFGGLSLSQMAQPYVDIWLQTRSSVAQLIHSFSVMVLMTDMQTNLQPGQVGNLLARAGVFNILRDNQGLFVVNKNTEDFKNVSASLSGLHELQSQSQEHMASVARIPLVKFTGIQPAGLNADSEGVIQVYDDTISAYQNRFMRPHLTTVVDFEHLSLWGEIDRQITWNFRQLRELTDEQKAEKVKRDMEARQGYVDMGAFSPAEIRKVAIDDPELPFAGLNPDDVPEPPAEGMGGEGEGEKGGEHDEGDRGGSGGGGGGGDPFKGGGGADAAIPFAADEAPFEEGKHPRDPDGKFASGSGGGSVAAPKKKTAFGGLYKETGKGPEANHKATVDFVLSKAPNAGSSYRQMLAKLIEESPKIGDASKVPALKKHLAQAFVNAGKQAMEEAKKHEAGSPEFKKLVDIAQKANQKATELGGEPAPATAPTPPPAPAVAPKPAAAPAAPPPAPEPDKGAMQKAQVKVLAVKNAGTTLDGMSPLNGGKELVKAAVQLDVPVEVAISAMSTAQLEAMKKTYGTVQSAYQKGQQYAATQKQNEIVQKAAKEKAEADEKAFYESINSPEAKEHAAALAGILSGASSAQAAIKHAAAKLKTAAPGLQKALTAPEAAQIIAYSGSYYRAVNNQLRAGVMTEQQWGFAKALNDALDKCPKYTGKPTARGATLTPAQIAEYKPGMIIEERGFTSTSTGSGFGGNVKYEVHGKTGVDIATLSNYPSEKEILYKAGTRFRIKSNEGNKIVLEEV